MKNLCKNHLLRIVKNSLGIKNPGDRQNDTTAKKALPYVVVYTDDQQHIQRNGKKVANFRANGQQVIRYKMFHVEIFFAIFIKGRSEAQVEELKNKFLISLDQYLEDDQGNVIQIDPEVTIPIQEEGILKQDESGLEIIIKCTGGIYKDVRHGIITGIEPIPEIEGES